MKRVLLHIGLSKTGTTALQSFFSQNQDMLSKKKICYYHPLYHYHTWGGPANADFLVPMTKQTLGLTSDELTSLHLSEEAAAIPLFLSYHDTLLLSEEYLFAASLGMDGFWQALRETIVNLAGEQVVIDVVLYLRRQDMWCLSRWKHAVCSVYEKETADFRIFAREHSDWMDYAALVAKLEAAFGKDPLIIRRYDPERFSGGDIFHDFLSAVGIEWSESFCIPGHDPNPSASIAAAEAVRAITRGDVPCNTDSSKLSVGIRLFSSMHSNQKELYPMSHIERAALLAAYEDGNRWIAERYFGEGNLFKELCKSELLPHTGECRDSSLTSSKEGCSNLPTMQNDDLYRKSYLTRDLTNAKTILKLASLPAWKQHWLLSQRGGYSQSVTLYQSQQIVSRNDDSWTIQPIIYITDRKRKLIYALNSKVACSSIIASFLDEAISDDYSVFQKVMQCGLWYKRLPEDRNDYHIFTFVRNPFSRLVSCYRSKYHTDLKDYKKASDLRNYLGGYLLEDRGFTAFIDTICQIPDRLMDTHFRLQYDLVYAPDGTCRCDYVGHFEKLCEEFEPIRKAYSLKSLSHLNRSDTENWMDYYTPELVRKVYEKYEKDIVAFDYLDAYQQLLEYVNRR